MVTFLSWFTGNLVYRRFVRKAKWEDAIIDSVAVSLMTAVMFAIIK